MEPRHGFVKLLALSAFLLDTPDDLGAPACSGSPCLKPWGRSHSLAVRCGSAVAVASALPWEPKAIGRSRAADPGNDDRFDRTARGLSPASPCVGFGFLGVFANSLSKNLRIESWGRSGLGDREQPRETVRNTTILLRVGLVKPLAALFSSGKADGVGFCLESALR